MSDRVESKQRMQQVNENTKRQYPSSHLLVYFLLANSLFACTNRPNNVLSDQKMENVLFDLYLAETAIHENRSFSLSDSLTRQELLQSIFKKHKISEQKLDTSLVWYNAHLDKYIKINENLSKRYGLLLTDLEAEKERIRIASTIIDTSYFYRSPSFWLQSQGRDQIHAFVNHTDTVQMNRSKQYYVQLTMWGMKDSMQSVLTLCVQCNDTNFIHRDTIAKNGLFEKQYSFYGNHQVQAIYGNLHVSDTVRQPLLISDFAVYQKITTILPPNLTVNENIQRK
ncbi:MAG: DUF4296 domain-containing protein [Candidatus Symbiothrix sp.]|jgi:hypothetical protein|nr:DUF4296 domain-containing protein [Candidatus Symbiothrix sp.]